MARNKTAKEMTALEMESLLLRQIDLADHEDIADIGGVEVSTISKWKTDRRIEKTAKLLFALGFKLVPQSDVFMDVEHIETVFDLAGKGLLAEKERILGQ